LLTIPLCINRPQVAAATANGNAATSTAKSIGRRRRDVELYQGPRQKRAIMTVCDPRQVFGARINYVDDNYFKVLFSYSLFMNDCLSMFL
jgi:hypothetical protein